ncbi:molybdopterin-dependent oxidoreductase [Rubrobacter tropicus]|uniref:Molybdopterin-dependent oxidoreductase n=1 Tax=Rubrobacter tropicus TaxID=2653851 RepID=A0A6G8QEW0_9ACTN|nr:molybdopterin-dependent oxidoreductase [Rubrobacter tropicus]
MRPFREGRNTTVRKDHPHNAETPPDLLRASFVTPTDAFYVRNHGDVPEVDPGTYRLKVSGLVQRPLELSLGEIKGLPKTEFASTLYCAGNRRSELMEKSPIPGKVAWETGAAGNARWGGTLLRDVLGEAGIKGGARHAAFTGLDRDVEAGTGELFGGSIPLGKATSDDVLLAYEMNGGPLAPEHGFPLRVVVGGYVGARSVKWLSEVRLQAGPSDNYYQAVEYKLFPPHVTAETADYSEGEMLGETPLNCVICAPQSGETLAQDAVGVRGYALTGGDRRVERVEVSADGGETWTEAALTEEGGPATWLFWEATLKPGPGPCEIVARATDSGGETQPETVDEVWNFQGYANNARHKVSVRVGG